MLTPTQDTATGLWLISEPGSDFAIGAVYSTEERAQQEADRLNRDRAQRIIERTGWVISTIDPLDESDKSERITSVSGLVLRWSPEREVWHWDFNGEHGSYGSLAAATRSGLEIICKRTDTVGA